MANPVMAPIIPKAIIVGIRPGGAGVTVRAPESRPAEPKIVVAQIGIVYIF